MTLADLDVAVEAGDWGAFGNLEELSRRAVEAALAVGLEEPEPVSLSILFTDDAAVRVLNRDWRGLDKPTNVLSFPAGEGPSGEPQFLGDIALACETLLRESAEEGKSPTDHATHLIVHGTLHLLGFDHETDEEAEEMEALEIEGLARIGVADPYRERE